MGDIDRTFLITFRSFIPVWLTNHESFFSMWFHLTYLAYTSLGKVQSSKTFYLHFFPKLSVSDKKHDVVLTFYQLLQASQEGSHIWTGHLKSLCYKQAIIKHKRAKEIVIWRAFCWHWPDFWCVYWPILQTSFSYLFWKSGVVSYTKPSRKLKILRQNTNLTFPQECFAPRQRAN